MLRRCRGWPGSIAQPFDENSVTGREGSITGRALEHPRMFVVMANG